MHRVLVPFDGSGPSQRALAFAQRLADAELDAEIYLLTVEPEPVYFGEIAVFVRKEDAVAQALAAAHRVQDAAAPAIAASKVPVHRHLRLGEPAPTIAAVAEELHCDWIIMGTRGLGQLTGLLMGSVTTQVLHLTDRPVTLVR
jgi:nucleotide-binding universal stress UspA family protein